MRSLLLTIILCLAFLVTTLSAQAALDPNTTYPIGYYEFNELDKVAGDITLDLGDPNFSDGLIHAARRQIEAHRALAQRRGVAVEEILPVRLRRGELRIIEWNVEQTASLVYHREADLGRLLFGYSGQRKQTRCDQ